MKRTFSAIVFCMSLFCVMAQDTGENPPTFQEIFPKSPESFSLGRYGDVPVGTYTGKPEISIPIYNISVRDFNLPISLAYDATGIRVDQEATVIGLGWNLMAGGMVNHIINGGDDEKPNTYHYGSYVWDSWLKLIDNGLIHDQNYFDVCVIENNSEYWTKHRIENYAIDWSCIAINPIPGGDYSNSQDDIVFREARDDGSGQLDIYSVALPGLSFKYIVDPFTNTPEIIGKIEERIKIDHGGTITITNSKGIKYNFSEIERTTSLNNSETTENGKYLTSIVLPEGDEIKFQYQRQTLYPLPVLTETRNYHYGNVLHPYEIYTQKINRFSNEVPYLSQIETDKEIVKFDLQDRLDLAGDGKRVTRITIIDKFTNSEIKRFDFTQSYFQGEISGFVTDELFSGLEHLNYDDLYTHDVIGKRLKLDKITIASPNATNEIYEFTYNTNIVLPAKSSVSRDHWGYFNDENNNTLIPDKIDVNYLQRGVGYSIGIPDYLYNSIGTYTGANRRMNPSVINAGMLEKITYPTKGSVSFEFESNEFTNYYTLLNTDYYPDWFTSFHLNVIDRNWGGASDILEKNFTLEKSTNVTFNAYITSGMLGKNLYDFRGCKVELIKVEGTSESTIVELYVNPSDPNIVNQTEMSKNTVVSLQAGDYSLRAYMKDEYGRQETAEGGSVEGYVNYQVNNEISIPGSQTMYGGGLRVKSITNKDELGNTIGYTNYTYENHLGNSSGLLMTPINYFECSLYKDKNAIITSGIEHEALRISSSSIIPLSRSASGSFVGYSKVKKNTIGQGETMLTSYDYSNEEDAFYKSLPSFPSLANGELLSVSYSDITGNVVKTVTYNYIDKLNEKLWLNTFVKDHYRGPVDICSGAEGTANFHIYVGRWEIINYPFQRLWRILDSKTVTQDGISSTITYDYSSDNYQLTEINSTFSNGDTSMEKISYPSISGSLGTKNIVSVPTGVEKYVNGTQVSGWDQILNNYGNPVQVTKYDPKNSVDYIERIVDYDASSQNIIELTKTGDYPTSVYWGYNNKYPIVSAQNATYQELETAVVAFCTANGLSVDDVLASVKDIATNSSQQNSWKSFCAAIQNHSSLQNSQVSLYTYNPLIGMTSQTDPNGIATYYKYDEFGRLIQLLDDDNNILKTYHYKYKDQ